MITPLRLRHAASLAEHGSFRRAAMTLRISQPALSKSVQALESALGVRLFERRRDGVIPTEFGRLVLEHTRGLVQAESELLRQIQLVAGLEAGELNIAFGPLPGAMSVYPAAGALLARHPNLRLSLQSISWREVIHAVIEKKVDLGIAEISGASHDDTLQTELLGEHRAYFLCRTGHPILRNSCITLAELVGYPWTTTRLPLRMAETLPLATGRAGAIDKLTGDFVPAVDVWSASNVGELIEQSEVLALAPLSLLERQLVSGTVVVVPGGGIDLRSRYGFVYLRSRPLSPAAKVYMAEIRAHEKLVTRHEALLATTYAQPRRATRR
jgi:DNA-binding transcriptional LysR family regulator